MSSRSGTKSSGFGEASDADDGFAVPGDVEGQVGVAEEGAVTDQADCEADGRKVWGYRVGLSKKLAPGGDEVKWLWVLLILEAVQAFPQSAKKIKAEMRDKVEAKVQKVDVVNGITLELKLASVFLTYDRCEKSWNRILVRGWFQEDPCKRELKRINDAL